MKAIEKEFTNEAMKRRVQLLEFKKISQGIVPKRMPQGKRFNVVPVMQSAADILLTPSAQSSAMNTIRGSNESEKKTGSIMKKHKKKSVTFAAQE